MKTARAAAPAGLRIQVEVESEADAVAAVEAGADFLLLDNCTPAQLRAIAARVGDRALLEASGGVRLENVREIAETGVSRISIGCAHPLRSRRRRGARDRHRRSRARERPAHEARSGARAGCPAPRRRPDLLRRLPLLRTGRLARAGLEGRRVAARAAATRSRRHRATATGWPPSPTCCCPRRSTRAWTTRWLARDLRWLETTDSTNRVALDLARDGAAHGTTVVAEAQTAGRGRLGRAFFSPPRMNLYRSIVLRPRLLTADAPPWILASAIAVAEAVEQTVGDGDAVEIKWPNDVLLGGLKTSGILMELSAEATRVVFLVLGIGVNLNVDRRDFPEEFRAAATSLSSHCGRKIDRVAFAQRLYNALERALDTCARARLRGAAAALRGALPDARSAAHACWSSTAPGSAAWRRASPATAPCCSGARTARWRAWWRAT